MQHLSSIWADVLAWGVILAGVVTCAGMAVRRDRRPRAAPPVIDVAATHQGPRRLGPEREWELVIGRAAQHLERSAALAALQAETALKIAAAEHAYNRLAADCARLCRISFTPTAAASRHIAHAPGRLPHAPEMAPGPIAERERLAA